MRANSFDEDLRPFIITLMGLLLKVIVALTAIDMLGIKTTSFVAMLAAASFAVGLALQGSLSNFASGILILFFKPFRTGDMIGIGDNIGVVQEIQIFNTILKTIHQRLIVIPNSILTGDVVENITGAGIIRLNLTFGIGYDDDIDNAREVVLIPNISMAVSAIITFNNNPIKVIIKGLKSSSKELDRITLSKKIIPLLINLNPK
jgi:small conductance mechanosensitive channel